MPLLETPKSSKTLATTLATALATTAWRKLWSLSLRLVSFLLLFLLFLLLQSHYNCCDFLSGLLFLFLIHSRNLHWHLYSFSICILFCGLFSCHSTFNLLSPPKFTTFQLIFPRTINLSQSKFVLLIAGNLWLVYFCRDTFHPCYLSLPFAFPPQSMRMLLFGHSWTNQSLLMLLLMSLLGHSLVTHLASAKFGGRMYLFWGARKWNCCLLICRTALALLFTFCLFALMSTL